MFELSAEEKSRIYEEERARLAREQKPAAALLAKKLLVPVLCVIVAGFGGGIVAYHLYLLQGNMATSAKPANDVTRTPAAPLDPTEAPFGFRCGMSTTEIQRLVGNDAVSGVHGDLLTLKTAPHPLALIQSYDLVVSPKDGLVRIDARVYVDSIGGQMFHTFTALRDATIALYGRPDTSSMPSTGNASAIWNLKSSLPGGLDAIVLLEDHSATKANVLLSYECKDFGDYLDRKKK